MIVVVGFFYSNLKGVVTVAEYINLTNGFRFVLLSRDLKLLKTNTLCVVSPFLFYLSYSLT